MAGIYDFGGSTDPLSNPAFGGPTGWAAAVADRLDNLVRVTRPNGDDRLVEQWNGSGWSVVEYDSGWRNLTTAMSLVNGWVVMAGGYFPAIRRKGDRVEFTAILDGTNATDIVAATLPAGFRVSPAGYHPRNLGTHQNSTGTAHSAQIDNAGVLTMWSGFGAGTSSVTVAGTWITDDPIPSSLPGTRFLAAPA